MMCVGNDNDVRAVASAAFPKMGKNTVFVDHTTASANIARELYAEAKKAGFDFVDAPVSGGQAGAVNGKLGIMCGGSEAAYAKAEPVMAVYTKMAKRLGTAGSGQLTKMANQICIAGIVQGMAEAYSLMRAAGLDIEAVTDVISKGAAQSWQMENRYKTMNAGEYNHGFAVEWMRKDLGIALEEARKQGVSLPVTALVDQFYAEVENLGGKRWDTSSLFVRQEHARKGHKS
jgi:3-hydroxyisobutyrate dehydrogenase